MRYRHLGRTGLKVSELGFGSWVTFGTQLDVGRAADILAAAREAGINLFDNAEAYAGGESERIMGQAIARLGWPRWSYVVTSKFFWGIHDDVNTHHTLNRKYLVEAVDASLERFGLDHLDIIYCHRPDPTTPIAETVFAMSELVSAHKAHYWGTSEWSAEEIRHAIDVATANHLHAPVVEQPQYNLLERQRVEHEYARLLDEEGIGLTTWSPLASGLLTGKYVNGVPAGSRATLHGYEWLRDLLTDPGRQAVVRSLLPLASRLEVSLAQLAIGWCLLNPHVSSVLLGATSIDQLNENLGALEARDRLTPAVVDEINAILAEHA
ncbi:aldo/keto reductase [Acidimicrobium ferrooxidans DSM 10331]|uniref:Aldo/keto reductase n=1 Tax=Acidimicrobium ferrooxidans (strain DSM 10331 / JCM 15462 / NBRC 103882 / ICP) TaxID=525909 RepID=C7M070_ACIFD|nr:aldo/keto reductase [Acidimicrobium ferrooxidans DSM 10331]